ncbi:hypothetical protein F2Q69_00062807 [Brassica cretica]|uniref:Uncharacterized protein n=1 Tax=Brassica cretica TaxID=69181 RepID=A0A8S9RD99_BRACR|nr:hypothetical protein F2Q69_00062807 [Brassica cretica]
MNQQACGVVETMWTQDAELAWDELEEKRDKLDQESFSSSCSGVNRLCKADKQVLAGHLSYWCDPEGEDVHDCSMQKTIMLKDGRCGHWKVCMKLLVRGINDAAWIAVKIGWEEPTIFTSEEKKPKPKEPRQGVVREECTSRGGKEHGDGRPDVDGAYLVGEKSISIIEDEDSATLVWENDISSVEVSRVNPEACGVVETMWTQEAELVWDKLEEQVYTVEKRQEINLGSKFMPSGINIFQEKESVLIIWKLSIFMFLGD